jgi:hypothetical protein
MAEQHSDVGEISRGAASHAGLIGAP